MIRDDPASSEGQLLLLCLLTARATAADIVACGTCGPSASWTLDGDALLPQAAAAHIP